MTQQANYFSAGRQAACFTLGLSVAAAFLGVWLRRGTGDVDVHTAALCLLVVATVTLTPIAIVERLQIGHERGALFYGPMVVALTLFIVLIHSWGSVGQGLVAVAALLSAGDLVARWQWRGHTRSVVLFSIGLGWGLVVAIHIQGGRYLTAFTQDFLPLGGSAVNTDTYMHLALAQMIRHQGVISTGVEGVTPISLYAMAHVVIGWLSDLFMQETVQAASEIYSIIMVPLMLGSVLFGAIALTEGKDRLTAAALLVGAAVLLYPNRTFFFSETYIIALFLFMSILVPAVAGIALGTAREPWSRAAIALLGLAGISLTTFGKPGVGTLAAGLFGLAAWIDAWRHPTLQQRLLWMALAALAVMIVFIPSFLAVSADIFSSVVSAISEKPYYHSLTWGPMKQFLLFNCVTLLAIAGVLLCRDLFGDRKRRIVLAIVLIVFMIAANIPGFFPVGTQWQYYIINVQMWLGLPALAALVSLFAAREGVLKNGWVKEISIIAAVLATFVGLFGFAFFKARYVDNMHASRGRMLQARANGMVKEREKVLEEIVAYRERFGARLRVYAPSTHSAFWEWVPHCEARSMTIPAITAVPMIQGYPPLWTECAGHIQLRGWQVIAPRVRDDVLSDEALCRDRATTSEDALAVYVLESLTETRHNRLVDCSGRS